MAGPIVISVLAQTASANRNLRVTAGISQRVGSSIRSMAAPAAAAVTALGLVGKQAIDAASDLSEAQSKNKVIFGRQAGDIESFSRRAATALGQSRTQALDAASTFGLIGQKAGLSGPKTAAFAKQFTTLASDLASFNNTSPEEAITAIGAAMRGEAEPIRRYGVLLDDMTLRTEAVRLGLVKTTKQALTPQQKALAASQSILRQTTKAQGDFARTSDGAANKQRIVAAQVENLKAKLGTQLLPVYQRALGIVSRVVAFFTKHQTVAKVLVGVMGALAVGILAVNAAMLLNPATLIIAGLVAAGAAVYALYQRNETFRTSVQAVGRFLRDDVGPALARFGAYLRDTVIPAVVATGQRVAGYLRPVFAQIGRTLRSDVIPVVQRAVGKFREWWPTIRRVAEAIGRLIARNVELAAKILGKVLPPVIRFAGFLIRTLVPAVVRNVQIFGRIIAAVVDFGRKIVNAVQSVARFANGVRQKIADVLGIIRRLPGQIVSGIGNLGSTLLSAGRDVIQGLINGIDDKIGDLTSKLGSVTRLIPDVKGPPAKDRVLLRRAGRLIIAGLIDGFNDEIPNVKATLSNLTKGIADYYKKAYPREPARARQAANARLKALRDEFRAVTRAGAALTAKNAQLAKERANLKGLLEASKQYVAGIRDSIVATASITNLGEGTGYSDSAGLLANLRARVEQTEKFAAIIEQLRRAKLDGSIIEQLANAGPDGLGAAETLLAGGAEAIAAYNRLQARLRAAGLAVGNTADQAMNRAAINAASALVRGLEREQRNLDRVFDRQARRLVNAVRRAFGVASTDRRVPPPRQQKTTVTVKLTAEQTSRVQRGREIQLDIDAYRRSGGGRAA